MTAASGIEHQEGRDHPGGTLHGFQCWVNLPAAHKMDPPRYQDVPARAIPHIDAAPGVRAKIIAGCAGHPRGRCVARLRLTRRAGSARASRRWCRR